MTRVVATFQKFWIVQAEEKREVIGRRGAPIETIGV